MQAVPISHPEAAQAWQQTQSHLALELQPEEYDTYVSPSKFLAIEDTELIIQVPHAPALIFLNDRYRYVIKQCLAQCLARTVQVRFIVGSSQIPDHSQEPTPLEAAVQDSLAADRSPPFRPSAAPLNLNPLYTFGHFVQGKHNQLALAAAEALADHPHNTTYMPLYIYGDVGLGKTHLLHAIGHRVRDRHAQVLNCTTEQFTNELVSSIRTQQMDQFRQRYRVVDLLLLDDVQFLGGKERTQEEFFYTFTELFEQNKRVVLTSDCAPKHIRGLEQRLCSRFEGGLMVDIDKPEYETRLAILQKKVQVYGYDIPMSLLQPIAQQVRNNIRELEGVLHRLHLLQTQTRELLTEEMVQSYLGTLIPTRDPMSPEELLGTVARFFSLEPSLLKGTSRKKAIVHARKIAMYLLRHEMHISLPRIGELMGGRDHKTVSYGVNQIMQRLAADSELEQALAALRSQVHIGS